MEQDEMRPEHADVGSNGNNALSHWLGTDCDPEPQLLHVCSPSLLSSVEAAIMSSLRGGNEGGE